MGTVMSKYTVDILTEEDKEWFIHTASVNMLEQELKRPELVNIPQLYILTDKVIKDHTAFVVKVDGVCVGALAAMLSPNLYNPQLLTFAELFWYVLPEYRNTRAGILLISVFDKRGEECADFSAMSLLGGSKVNEKTMKNRGYALSEYAFLREHRRTEWQ